MTLYLTVEEADNYFKTRPFSEKWFGLNEEEKLQFLTLAQKHIDSLPLIGRKLNYNQENQFPRFIVDKSLNYMLSSDSIPQEIKDAVCEEAFAILKYMNEERYALREQGVQSAARGGLSESYEKYSPLDILVSPEAHKLLRNWILDNPTI